MDTEGTVAGLETLIKRVEADADASRGLMLLSCDENGFSAESVDPILKACRIPLFGGIFPYIILGRQAFSRGTIAVTLPAVSPSRFVPEAGEEDVDLADRIEATFADIPSSGTMIIFVDGQTQRTTHLMDGLFDVFGLDLNYVGGGAGALSMLPKPCLFTNDGLMEKGAVIAFLPCASGVGVCHGWRELCGPYSVTESTFNVIQTLDWRPALDVYVEALMKHAGVALNADDIFTASKLHPLGVLRLGEELIVREPLRIGENGSLICAGEVREGSFVHILKSDAESLVEAAGMALERARNARPAWKQDDLHVFVDCISRKLLLRERYSDELASVSRDHPPLVGAYTIGEIANSGAGILEFYNNTAVIAILDSQ
jgi:hypothetical protein